MSKEENNTQKAYRIDKNLALGRQLIEEGKKIDTALKLINKSARSGETKGKSYFEKSTPVSKIADTIGCGDSFRAGCLSYVEDRKLDELKEKEIRQRLKKGNECGAKTCLVNGALHAY